MNDGEQEPETDPDLTAALYVAGALPADEFATFEEKLQRGDRAAVDAVASFDGAVGTLASGLRPIKPSPAVLDQILGRIDADLGESSKAGAAVPDIFTLHAQEGDWVSAGVPGVDMRVLFTDPVTKRQTALYRMAPGSTFPSHDHDDVEECYVIAGDLESAGEHLEAGDYQRCAAHTQHGTSSTVNGCLLLITSAA